jgi:hypothetical protein
MKTTPDYFVRMMVSLIAMHLSTNQFSSATFAVVSLVWAAYLLAEELPVIASWLRPEPA